MDSSDVLLDLFRRDFLLSNRNKKFSRVDECRKVIPCLRLRASLYNEYPSYFANAGGYHTPLMAADTQELSFQNVVDTILKPEGIKVGGFADDLFLDLQSVERDKWQCNICFLVSRDPKQCDNKHNFCATCIFAWSMTYGANSDKCPVCRHKQQDYLTNRKLTSEIMQKWVKCPETGCALRCPLRDFVQHSHGIKLYGVTPELDRLRRSRPDPVSPALPSSSVIMLPSLRGPTHPMAQGRNLLQDMMLVLHMEMELRRRAINQFQSEDNVEQRQRHFNEVIAIQSQMQEITSFLDVLLRLPSTTTRNTLIDPPQRSSTMTVTAPPVLWPDLDSDSDSSSESNSELSDLNPAPRPPPEPRATPALRRLATRDPPTAVTSLTGTASRVSEDGNAVAPVGNQRSNQSLARTPTTPATLNSASVPTGGTEEEIVSVLHIDQSTNGSEGTSNSLPRASTTYQTARAQLPPIAGAEQEQGSPREEANQVAGESNTPTTLNPSPGVTAAPHRRPAPPAGPGVTLSVRPRQHRRRISASSLNPNSNNNNNSTTNSTRTNTNNSNTAPNTNSNRTRANNTRNTPAGNATPSRAAATTRPAAGRARTDRNQTNTSSTLPATSGALLRARRRSEIQQQLIHNCAGTDGQDRESHSRD